MAKGDDIEERLIDFAVRIVKLYANLPWTQAGKHIGGQLLRSGTAPAPHYAEARSAESKKDFVHKLKLSLKELNKSQVWLKIIVRSEMMPKVRLRNLMTECDELCKIVSSSIRTTIAGSGS